jgi:hypothetical protein
MSALEEKTSLSGQAIAAPLKITHVIRLFLSRSMGLRIIFT